jgi:hypothetical protein
MDDRELTLTDLLADPMTLAVMAADQVDPAALEAALSGLAWRLELARTELNEDGSASGGQIGHAELLHPSAGLRPGHRHFHSSAAFP